jgi:hypothetical protein
MNSSNKISYFIFGLILFIIPLTFFSLWMYACSVEPEYPGNVELYKSYLPAFLRNTLVTTVISLGCCIAAVVVHANNLNGATKGFKILSWIMIVASALLGFLNLFSML